MWARDLHLPAGLKFHEQWAAEVKNDTDMHDVVGEDPISIQLKKKLAEIVHNEMNLQTPVDM